MTTIDPYAALGGTSSSAATQTANDAGSADRFLKLLVTQMQNQDPLNPMDNAQITSQMAQINTVNGITTLNATVSGLNTQFVQMQALQGASLVGHDVTVKGSGLQIVRGVGVGGFELAGAADSIKLEVLDAAGQVVDTQQLGAESGGKHFFQWDASGVPDGSAYTFRVTPKSGAATVPSTPLMLDRVVAVSSNGNTLKIELERLGNVAYSDIQAFN